MTQESPNFFISRLLVKSYRIIKTFNRDFLEARGYDQFKIGHIMVMMHLEDQGSLSIDLAKKAQISKQAMSSLVRELINHEFLCTQIHPLDKRSTLLKKTDKGIKFLDDLKSCRIATEDHVAQIIGINKLQLLKEILFEIVDDYEKNDSNILPINEMIAKTKI